MYTSSKINDLHGTTSPLTVKLNDKIHIYYAGNF